MEYFMYLHWQMGCFVLVSAPEVIDICQDKRKTYRFLLENDFDTPRHYECPLRTFEKEA